MNVTIFGKHGVSATVLRDSISTAGIRMLSFEVVAPRLILSEENTHRALSKNSASSRAIPFHKMAQNLNGRPVRFGAANPGMQDTGVDFAGLIAPYYGSDGEELGYTPEQWWETARDSALYYSEEMYKAGYAKQVYNRLTEPFQMMKTVISGTELENFFWLRDDIAADPSLAELARCMREARDASTPDLLQADEWHLPYVDYFRDEAGDQVYFTTLDDGFVLRLDIEDAIKMSCARAAAVSFRNTDYGLEKCREVYERLVGDERKHASALEHQAKAMPALCATYRQVMEGTVWSEPGISHMDRNGHLWSGNLRGWIQHRKTIPGENKSAYDFH